MACSEDSAAPLPAMMPTRGRGRRAVRRAGGTEVEEGEGGEGAEYREVEATTDQRGGSGTSEVESEK